MASTAAQTAAKTGETTGETGETTAGNVAAEPVRRKARRRTTNLGLSTARAYFRSKYLIVNSSSGCDTLVMLGEHSDATRPCPSIRIGCGCGRCLALRHGELQHELHTRPDKSIRNDRRACDGCSSHDNRCADDRGL
jgi:hypothetical protein